MADLTPMMRQYLEIKEQNKDSILFFRLGDFYEMFNEDAKLAARELDLVLTTRDRGKSAEEQTPMCGIPYHSSDGYIARLIAKGYKVAICEQTEDPALAKGLVKRDIIRVVTPGTVIDSACLDDRRGNFLCGVFLDEQNAGVAFCDMSTGHTHVTAFSGADRAEHLCNELARFSPAEAVLSAGAYADEELKALLADRLSCRVERGDARFDLKAAEKAVLAQYGEDAYASLPRNNPAAALALGGLLSYLHETQKSDLSYISDLEYYEQGRFMELDLSARRNLELTETIRGKEKRGSLLWVLDKTKTAMGARCLRSWLERPLREVAAITRRSNAVGALVNDTMAREELVLALSGISDMERLIGRIVYGTAGGRDLVSLRNSIEHLAAVREQLAHFTTGRLGELSQELDPLTDIAARIAETIVDEPPFSVREGGILRSGYSEEVDRLRNIRDNGAKCVAELEAREKERTGIKKLKVGYNKVFGYYIDVPNSAGAVELPEEYIRKQTLVNGERYFTPELKKLEDDISSARERIETLEYDLFRDVLRQVGDRVDELQALSAALAELDALCSLAEVAVRNNYVCPEIEVSHTLTIAEGRHPVVEQMQRDTLFVPNDTHLNDTDDRVAIVTGPNMAGKSTYMRQTAIIVLMAQIGSFVPARSATVGICDRVFTRIGASDDLAGGASTFMVEMSEVASILKNATADSLLILDEIGRGTSTYDGMAIARAVLEYCADARKLGAKTMFATHYHELSALEGTIPGVRNYNISAKRQNGKLLFLRKILPGAADESYGIEVAKLAGVPESVIRAADAHLRELNAQGAAVNVTPPAKPESDQVSLADVGADAVAERLRAIDPNTLSPLEALRLLFELKNDLG